MKSLNQLGYHELDGARGGRAVRLTASRWAPRATTPRRFAALLRLVDRLGFDAVDAGPLANGSALEPDGSPFAITYDYDELSELIAPGRSYPLPPCRAPSSGPCTPRGARLVEHLGGHRRRAGGRRRRSSARGSASCCRAGLCCSAQRSRRPLRTDTALAAIDRAAAVRDRLRAHLLGRAVRAVGPHGRAVRRAAALRRAARVAFAAGGAAAAAAAGRDRDRALRAGRSRSGRACTSATGRGRRWPRPRCASRRWRARSATSRSSAAGARSTRSCSTAGRCSAAARCCSPSRRPPRTGARRSGPPLRSARSSTWRCRLGFTFVTLTSCCASCRR